MPIFTLAEFHAARETALTLGTFDGLHLGHRALLERTAQRAREQRLQSVAFVFRRPPQNYVSTAKSLILPIEKKLATLAELAEIVLAVEFPEIGWMEAAAFVQKILSEKLRARAVTVGPDARFGKERRGDAELLRRLGAQHGFVTEVIPKVIIQGQTVSATAIREHLTAGRVEQAQALLGYPPKLFGIVIKGDGRGHKMGYPTANLQIDREVLLPAAGVYAVRVGVGGSLKAGALYIGARATFANATPGVEVHLFDTDESLYGLELEVELHARIRDDARFDSLEALRAQIAKDIETARLCLSNRV